MPKAFFLYTYTLFPYEFADNNDVIFGWIVHLVLQIIHKILLVAFNPDECLV